MVLSAPRVYRLAGRVFVLQSRRYSSGSSCWGGKRYILYRHTPGSDAVQKRGHSDFLGGVTGVE